jgi:glycosyltransferase involved in cell wall biosynthesis
MIRRAWWGWVDRPLPDRPENRNVQPEQARDVVRWDGLGSRAQGDLGVGANATQRRATVTVIVPAWNVEPWVEQCLHSVATQTLGTDRIRLIAVDDGSTDRTGELLDAFAATHPWATVIHQAPSGGPGAPRNTGLAHATGEYVFFLDADDYLGPEALQRMVAMAERVGSDIVIGRYVSVDGRFGHDTFDFLRRDAERLPRAAALRTASALKLFNRRFLEGAALRFPEGVAGAEDSDFMVHAYADAGVISVVGGYPCYYARRRPGSQTTRRDRDDDIPAYVERLALQAQVSRASARVRPLRDLLLVSAVRRMAGLFGRRWARLDPAERRRAFDAGAAFARVWSSALTTHFLPRWAAIRVWCLRKDAQAALEDIAAVPPDVAYREAIVEGRHIYARFPHFRDETRIPDACFDIRREVKPSVAIRSMGLDGSILAIEGRAYLRMLGGSNVLVLRGWPGGPLYSVAVEAVPTPDLHDLKAVHPLAGFRGRVDLSRIADGRALPRGVWALEVEITTPVVSRRAPVPLPPGTAAQVVGAPRSGPYVLRPACGGFVRLYVGSPGSWIRTLEFVDGIHAHIRRGLIRVVARLVPAAGLDAPAGVLDDASCASKPDGGVPMPLG